MNICIVFVCNKKYFNRFISTCTNLIEKGNYSGNICLIIGDDLNNTNLLNHNLIKSNNIIVKYFPDIQFPDSFYKINNNIGTDGRNKKKKFQWHKLHLFNVYFKQWEKIFYLDCGIKILKDISPILNIETTNTLLAHSDSYPTYKWKLFFQFDKSKTSYYSKLEEKYDLNIDYFQSTIMLYDTKIIEEETYKNLLNIAIKYPISKTNEQGIMNLYFNCEKKIWKQIPFGDENIKYYNFSCLIENKEKYIMVKRLLKK